MSYDWLSQGKAFNHLVYPPTKIEVVGFEDGLEEVINGKLEECLNRREQIEANRKKRTEIIVKSSPKRNHWFWARLLASEYVEIFYIDKWIAYWLELAKKLGVWSPVLMEKADRFSDLEIEKARQFPLTQLIPNNGRVTGGRIMALCPFHEEKTPSLCIYLDENKYHCFGCGVSGDVIDYLMKKENLSFPEAVRRLI